MASTAAVLVMLLLPVVGAGQLPPEVQADAELLQVERAISDGNYDQAWARLQNIRRLQTEHDLDLPEFDFWHAQTAQELGLSEQALESVTRYLTASGRDATHYGEALALLNTLQVTVNCDGWNASGYFKTATLNQVTACLETGSADLEARNASGRTPLHSAGAHAQDPAVVEALLDAGAYVESTDAASGATPLGLALRDNGTPAVIEVLLDAGADLETPDAFGLTPLHVAATHVDDPAVFHILLMAGSGLTAPDQVLDAAERSIEILIDAGANPRHLEQALDSFVSDLAATDLDVANDVTAPALMETVQAAVLCQEWNTTGYFETATPDHVAACLATGTVDLTARGATGLTPLQAAAVEATNPGVIESLLASGADPAAASRVESGHLGVGDTVRANGAYQDSYAFGFLKYPVVEVTSDDFDTYLIVESPSGLRFVNDDYHGDTRRSQLSPTLDEDGEYQVSVSSYTAGESGEYTLRVTREAPAHMAARSNENPAVLKIFLDAGPDRDHTKADGSTLLHAAAQNQNPAVIQAVLAAGADVNEGDEGGRIALHLAARYNENLEVLEALVAAGSNVREDDNNEWTPLHFASGNNENPAIVEALLAAGANIEEKADDGYRPLHLAARYNENPAVAQTLLDAGAELRPSAGFYRNTPLRLAAASNENPAVVQVLIDAGAEVNDGDFGDGDTALHYAARSNEPAMVAALLAAGADLEIRNDDGETPLHFAAGYNEPAMVEALLAVGADLETRNDDGETPLLFAARYNANPAMLKALLAAGADPLSEDRDDSTALHLAARYSRNPAVLEALLAARFDLEAQDDEERTPLHLAARYNENPTMVEALVAAGADIEALDEDGRTSLYRATDENDNPAVREALLRAGAGRTEARARARASSQEDGVGRGIAALIGGAAIAAAGVESGASPETVADAVGQFAEGVLTGQPAGGTSGTPFAGQAPTNTGGVSTSGPGCQIPGYPTPANVQNLGLSWCESNVDFQKRVFALQAAGAWCAIDGGTSSTPEQIRARHQEINTACDTLDALQARLGGRPCSCPAGYRAGGRVR